MQTKNPAAVSLGKLGGKVKSEKKAKSSAENGKLGGRPRNKCGCNCHKLDEECEDCKFRRINNEHEGF